MQISLQMLFLALLLSLLLPQEICGHALMVWPQSRSFQAYLAGQDYTPQWLAGKSNQQCLQSKLCLIQQWFTYRQNMIPLLKPCSLITAGGVGTTSSTGAAWPNGPHGICGDPYSAPQTYMQVCFLIAATHFICSQVSQLSMMKIIDPQPSLRPGPSLPPTPLATSSTST